MNRTLTRRHLIATAPVALATGILSNSAQGGEPVEAAKPALWPGFPRQDAKLVAEVVGKSHSNETRVKELVKAHPALVNSWWDWGFGDWESPLGAASHVGQRGIAEFLLEHGARIDIFAAAMLGHTAVLKAFVAAQPGVQRKPGPHGITLLAHAKAGGPPAADAVAYLESLGDADTGYQSSPLPEERKKAYIGKYAVADGEISLECLSNKAGRLQIALQQPNTESTSRNIYYLGEDEFFPSGVPSVRFKFDVENGQAKSLTIRGTNPILTAKRI